MVSQRKQRMYQALADFSAVVLIATVFLILFLNVNPFARGFYCTDESIRFPLKADTVKLWVAGLYGSLGGVCIVIFVEVTLILTCETTQNRIKSCLLNCLYGVLFYALGAISTLLITEVGKHTTGRLRPNFIAVCQPDWDKINCFEIIKNVSVANYVHFKPEICKGDPFLIKESRLSFPSGHSSFSVYSMMFVIIYMEARLILRRMRFPKIILQLIAFVAAWHTVMSRVSDFKHHYTDVIAGSLLGMSVAVFMTVVNGKRLWDYQYSKSLNEGPSAEDQGDIEDQREAFEL